MIVNGKNYETVWMEGNTIRTIEQRLLPHEFKIVELKTVQEAASSIHDMMIRGAPAIGGMAVYGMALSALAFQEKTLQDFHAHLEKDAETLNATRPTAYDLFHGTKHMMKELQNLQTVGEAKNQAVKIATSYAERSVEACKKIGEYGNTLIKENDSILTHCNAGALATIDYGTALSPMRIAHYNKKQIHVFVDETRPRAQGAQLTAWELAQEGIPHSLIVDNAAGYFMKKGEINLVITGADRVALNGDVANKIGTYSKAVLAKENNIPFYIAAPFTTIDPNTKTGDDIPIEERGEEEVHHIQGLHEGKLRLVRISPKESRARNPAFDVTPATYISGIITERGIFKPEELKKQFSP